MFSQHDLPTVSYMIDRFSSADYPFTKAHAQVELNLIAHGCRNRVMTDMEQRAFAFASATIAHIDANLKMSSCLR